MQSSALSMSGFAPNSTVRLRGAHFELRRVCRKRPRVYISQIATAPDRLSAARRRHFLNLSNGLEAAEAVASLVGVDAVRVTRLQSSHCEAQAYDAVLRSLGPELLFSLAVGYNCYLYDFGSRDSLRGVPRSLFLGLQFVKWAIAYLWFDETADVVLVRGKNVATHWKDVVMPYKIEKKTKKMIRYYKAFAEEAGVKQVRLFGVYGRVTAIDGCKDAYARIVRNVWETDDIEEEQGFEEWLNEQSMCVYNAGNSAEELVQRQVWMCHGKEDSGEI